MLSHASKARVVLQTLIWRMHILIHLCMHDTYMHMHTYIDPYIYMKMKIRGTLKQGKHLKYINTMYHASKQGMFYKFQFGECMHTCIHRYIHIHENEDERNFKARQTSKVHQHVVSCKQSKGFFYKF